MGWRRLDDGVMDQNGISSPAVASVTTTVIEVMLMQAFGDGWKS